MQTFQSLRDMSYQQAKIGDALESITQYAIDHIAGFPETCPPEAKAELYDGYRMRKAELIGDNVHAVVDGNYVKPTDEMLKNKKVEKVNISVDFAFSFTAQEFGKLKGENPTLHAVVGQVRNQTQTYCSNRFGDLVSKAKKLINKDTRQSRKELTFVESLQNMFDAQEKSCKVKQAKGDPVANIDKYKKAVAAFWSALK